MSEAELHILPQRLHQGRLNKARRGELATSLPVGYVRHASGEVRRDPDEQVQAIVRLIFRKFEELGTLNGVLRYLVATSSSTTSRWASGCRADRTRASWSGPGRTG